MVLAQIIQTTIAEAHQALTLLEMGAQESHLQNVNDQNDISIDKTNEKSNCWNFSTCHKIRENRYENEVYKPFSSNLKEDVKEFLEIKDSKNEVQILNQNQENSEFFEKKHENIFQTRSISPELPSMVAGTVVQSWKTSSLKRPVDLILPKKTGHCQLSEEVSTPLDTTKTIVHDSTTSIYSDISSPLISETATEYYLSDHSQDMLMQIIRCFPFPSPKNSPKIFKRQQSRNSTQNEFEIEPCSSGDLASPTSPIKQKKHFFARQGNPVSNLFHKHLNHEKRKRAESSISENAPGSSIKEIIDGRSYAHSTTSAPGFCAINGSNGVNSETANFTNIGITRGALSTLCQVSVDTMAITALPLDCWLKERLKNWVQLSGHKGTIVPATNQTLWKKLGDSVIEADAYEKITIDSILNGFTPKYYKKIQHKDDSFIEIQDLLADFPNVQTRAVMDIKIGTRTFLESEVANTKKRHDLYNKMIAIDPNEPTEEEKTEEAITKLRYMQFRERESSTNTLGFRIEAAQLPGGILQKSFQKIRTHDQVVETLKNFLGEKFQEISRQFEMKLRTMRDAIEKSNFFKTHEIVGSSILFIYDHEKSGAWMIDFAKATKVDENMTLNHRQKWQVGNREDGYLVGLDNLIQIFSECYSKNS